MTYSMFTYHQRISGQIIAEYECRIDAELTFDAWVGGKVGNDLIVNAIELSVIDRRDEWVNLPADHPLYAEIEAEFMKTGEI